MILSVHVPPLKQELSTGGEENRFFFRSQRGHRGRCETPEQKSLFEGSPFSAVRDVGFAVDAGEAGPACARVGVDIVGARGPVLAGGAQALVDFQGAAVPHETRQAAAVEGVDLVRAGSPVETGIWWSQREGFFGVRYT